MNYALSRPTTARRGGVLGVVVALHVAALATLLAARAVAPGIVERPLVVDLLEPPAEQKQPDPKPLSVVRPLPTRPKQAPAPKPQMPLLEATASALPTMAAPTTSPPEARPEPPAEPPATQARFDADYLKNPAPTYPPLSRRMGEEGKVVLRVTVTAQGTADGVEIRTSSGSQRLDDAAVNTVRRWKFVPARRGDTPVQSWVLVPVIFKLEH